MPNKDPIRRLELQREWIKNKLKEDPFYFIKRQRDFMNKPGNRERAREGGRKWRKEHPDRLKTYSREWREKHPGRDRQLKRESLLRMKLAIISSHYSEGAMRCQNCGEDNVIILTIDHKNGGGAEHRRQIGSQGGSHFYARLRTQGYPEGYQVLCFNCNYLKYYNELRK